MCWAVMKYCEAMARNCKESNRRGEEEERRCFTRGSKHPDHSIMPHELYDGARAVIRSSVKFLPALMKFTTMPSGADKLPGHAGWKVCADGKLIIPRLFPFDPDR